MFYSGGRISARAGAVIYNSNERFTGCSGGLIRLFSKEVKKPMQDTANTFSMQFMYNKDLNNVACLLQLIMNQGSSINVDGGDAGGYMGGGGGGGIIQIIARSGLIRNVSLQAGKQPCSGENGFIDSQDGLLSIKRKSFTFQFNRNVKPYLKENDTASKIHGRNNS